MFRRLAQSAFYLLLLASGEEFDAVVVDTYCAQQYAGERYEPCWQRCASQPVTERLAVALETTRPPTETPADWLR